MSGARLLMDGAAGLLGLLGVRVVVHGQDQLAGDRPLVVAANHVSYVDFAAIQAARPEGREPLRFLARWDPRPSGARIAGDAPVRTRARRRAAPSGTRVPRGARPTG